MDHAKWKLQLNGWVSTPTGYFHGKNAKGYFDGQRDFSFRNYVVFAGKLDWRFKRKHHLFFDTTPVVSSRTTTLTRTISWQGQTYDVGAQVNEKIDSLFFTPGYQYDVFRFRQIWLGLPVSVNLAYPEATLKATGSVLGGTGSTTAPTSSSGSSASNITRERVEQRDNTWRERPELPWRFDA